jgi:hypothetical protein
VEYFLGVYHISFGNIETDIRPEKFFYQHRYVKFQYIESPKVATLSKSQAQTFCKLLKSRCIFYIFIENAVNHAGLSGYRNSRIYQMGANFLYAIWRYFQNGYFNNPICRNIDSRGFKVKKCDEDFLKFKFIL